MRKSEDSFKTLIIKSTVLSVVANAGAVIGIGLGVMAVNKYTERKNRPTPKQ